MKKRAVGYCRISTLMQVDNTSLKDQEDKIIINTSDIEKLSREENQQQIARDIAEGVREFFER